MHVRFAREEAARHGVSLTVPGLAGTLRRLGYGVKILTALGGGGGGACLRNLRHSFLTVELQGESRPAPHGPACGTHSCTCAARGRPAALYAAPTAAAPCPPVCRAIGPLVLRGRPQVSRAVPDRACHAALRAGAGGRA
jgi:hypothetical protein